MKKQIYKYLLNPNDTSIEMPIGAEILSVQSQKDDVYIWALVDPNAEKEIRDFEAYATGQEIYYDMGVVRKYINTFQLENGTLVFHVFERIN